jgi:outer membrane protein assembly factor BamA
MPQILNVLYMERLFKWLTEIGMPLDGYTQSDISLNASFDSRDNVANPYDGRYALMH